MKEITKQFYVVKTRDRNTGKYITTGEIELVVWYDGEIVWKEMI